MNGIFLIIPVWGASHVERLCTYTIPSLLAPGNIPALCGGYNVIALIYSNREDIERLQGQPAIQHLKEACNSVEFCELGRNSTEMGDILHPGHRHSGTMLKVCHNKGINRAWVANYGFCPLAADVFYADGWGQNILNTVASGKRALGNVGIRLPNSLSGMLDENCHNGIIQISAQVCSRRYIDLLHTIGQMPSYEVGATNGGITIAALSGRGFVTRAQHLNMEFMYPKKGPVWCNRSTDNDLAHQALDSWDEVNVMQSSSIHFSGGIEGLGDSIPSKPDAWTKAAAACTVQELSAIWVRRACNDWHIHWWLQFPIWIEDGTLTRAEKEPLERLSQIAVENILTLHKSLILGNVRPEVKAAEAALGTWW